MELAEEVSVWFGAILRGDQLEPIRVGPRSNLQDACVLHSDPGKPLTLGAIASLADPSFRVASAADGLFKGNKVLDDL